MCQYPARLAILFKRLIGGCLLLLLIGPTSVPVAPHYSIFGTPNDPALDQQWPLQAIHAAEAWDTTTGAGITIAILDTGVSPTHLDLKRNLLPGYDFVAGDADARDDEGHGTHMAGVAAAEGNNALGVAGVCWGCKILPVKVLGRRGQGDDTTIAAGLRYAVDNGARIVSMSLGSPEDSPVLREAVDYAHQRGVLLVAASGNNQARGNLPNYPAAYPTVLAVAATDRNDQPATFSTSGSFVKLAAPGVGVWSTLWVRLKGDGYGAIDGTSPAASFVAGAAGLLLTLRPELTPAQVAEVLMASADDIGAPGRDDQTGYGRLNLAHAVVLVQASDLLERSTIQGVVSGIDLAGVTITLGTERSTQPDANGAFRFEQLPPGTYTLTLSTPGGQTQTAQASLSGTQMSVATVNFHFGTPQPAAFLPVPAPNDPAVAYFPATGHTLRGAFQRYWLANGGLAVFGYPISEELTERGDDGRDYTVQYFERHRIELHPEKPAPYNLQLSRMGDLRLRQQGRDWFGFQKGVPQPGCRYFAETGHNLCQPFLSTWRASGLEFDGKRGISEAESLALFGLPLSEPQLETLSDGVPRVVQWFERARFESHGQGVVLLGLLGNEMVGKQ